MKYFSAFVFVVLATEATLAYYSNHYHVEPKNCTLTPTVECDLDAHHMHCHDQDNPDIHLCIGQTISVPNKCQEMTCIHYDGDVVLLRSCFEVDPSPGCYLSGEDLSKSYPDCCPKEVCP